LKYSVLASAIVADASAIATVIPRKMNFRNAVPS
jgi:hypothetical protein